MERTTTWVRPLKWRVAYTGSTARRTTLLSSTGTAGSAALLSSTSTAGSPTLLRTCTARRAALLSSTGAAGRRALLRTRATLLAASTTSGGCPLERRIARAGRAALLLADATGRTSLGAALISRAGICALQRIGALITLVASAGIRTLQRIGTLLLAAALVLLLALLILVVLSESNARPQRGHGGDQTLRSKCNFIHMMIRPVPVPTSSEQFQKPASPIRLQRATRPGSHPNLHTKYPIFRQIPS